MCQGEDARAGAVSNNGPQPLRELKVEETPLGALDLCRSLTGERERRRRLQGGRERRRRRLQGHQRETQGAFLVL